MTGGEGGTLTVLNANPQPDFDPACLCTSGGGNVPSLVFRTLTTRNRENGAAGTEVVPDLRDWLVGAAGYRELAVA